MVVERSPEHRMLVMTVLFESITSWRELHIAEQLSAMRMRWDGRESVYVSVYMTVKIPFEVSAGASVLATRADETFLPASASGLGDTSEI